MLVSLVANNIDSLKQNNIAFRYPKIVELSQFGFRVTWGDF